MTRLDQRADSRQDEAGLNPIFLAVGKLRRPHGLHGEIIMEVWTDFPERLRPGMQVFLGEERLPARLRSIRQRQPLVLVSLEGYTTREAAAGLRNLEVCVRAVDIPPLPEGEYYHHQLLGLTVFDDRGQHLGELTEIIATGSNDVFVVRTPSGPDLLIPFLDSLLLKVDLDRRELHTRLLPGLLPE